MSTLSNPNPTSDVSSTDRPVGSRWPGVIRWLQPVVDPVGWVRAEAAHLGVEDDDEEWASDTDFRNWLNTLQLKVHHRLIAPQLGHHRSVLKGVGLELANLREYVPGDDIRKIDWNVYARTLVPHIKEFQDERQLTTWVLLDMTSSMAFGRRRSKWRQALEALYVLATVMERHGHRLGVYAFNGKGHGVVVPRLHPSHPTFVVERCFQWWHGGKGNPVKRDSAAHDFGDGAGDEGFLLTQGTPEAALGSLARLRHGPGSMVCVMSDFLHWSESEMLLLGQLAQQGPLWTWAFLDRHEVELPVSKQTLWVEDTETARCQWLNLGNRKAIQGFNQQLRQAYGEGQAARDSLGPSLTLDTEDDVTETLLQWLVSSLGTGRFGREGDHRVGDPYGAQVHGSQSGRALS